MKKSDLKDEIDALKATVADIERLVDPSALPAIVRSQTHRDTNKARKTLEKVLAAATAAKPSVDE